MCASKRQGTLVRPSAVPSAAAAAGNTMTRCASSDFWHLPIALVYKFPTAAARWNNQHALVKCRTLVLDLGPNRSACQARASSIPHVVYIDPEA